MNSSILPLKPLDVQSTIDDLRLLRWDHSMLPPKNGFNMNFNSKFNEVAKNPMLVLKCI